MGRVIDLHQARARVRSRRPASSAGVRAGDLAAALSNCLTVRRQIGAMLEVTVAIEELIERRADRKSHRELLERLWTSRRELMTAFKNVSATVDALSQALAGRS